jgi:hypothetical protein
MPRRKSETHQVLTDAAVWRTLHELAERRCGQKLIASAYLGDRSSDRLGLGNGDVLVVALSEANARNGSVSPKALLRLMRRGVSVFVEESLHAKVYVLGDAVVIGSANISDNSITVLREAAILTHDPRLVGDARDWVRSLCNAPATPEWLEHCAKLYRPPQRATGRRAAGSVPGRVWLVGVVPMDFPAEEEEARAEGEAQAAARLRPEYETVELRFREGSRFVREVKPGDIVIHVCEEGTVARVHPHARVLATRAARRRDGGAALYVYIESPAAPRTISWGRFSKAMSTVGLRLGRRVGARELRGAAMIELAKILTVPGGLSAAGLGMTARSANEG